MGMPLVLHFSSYSDTSEQLRTEIADFDFLKYEPQRRRLLLGISCDCKVQLFKKEVH